MVKSGPVPSRPSELVMIARHAVSHSLAGALLASSFSGTRPPDD